MRVQDFCDDLRVGRSLFRMCQAAHVDARSLADHVGVEERYRIDTRNALVVIVLVLVLLSPLVGLLPGTAYALSFAIPITEKTIYCGPGTDFGCHGSSKSEKFEGTIGPDKIFARGGADYALGHRGADTISGGKGADMVNGGRGHDYIFGNDGNDVLDGGHNGDYLQGGSRRDYIFGGPGDDTIYVAEDGKRDYVECWGGYDTVYGGPSENLAYGDCERFIVLRK